MRAAYAKSNSIPAVKQAIFTLETEGQDPDHDPLLLEHYLQLAILEWENIVGYDSDSGATIKSLSDGLAKAEEALKLARQYWGSFKLGSHASAVRRVVQAILNLSVSLFKLGGRLEAVDRLRLDTASVLAKEAEKVAQEHHDDMSKSSGEAAIRSREFLRDTVTQEYIRKESGAWHWQQVLPS